MTVTIGRPNVRSENGRVRLAADIKAENRCFTLWYETEKEYGQYLAAERCDSFLTALLPWIMIKAKRSGQDVKVLCEERVSAKLLHQLKSYYIPVLSRSISYYASFTLPIRKKFTR